MWQLGVGTAAAALSLLILLERKLPTASDILFLYNKVNILSSPWHQDTYSYCSTASSLSQSEELAAAASVDWMLPF